MNMAKNATKQGGLDPALTYVTEVPGVFPPAANRLYEFTVTKVLSRDGDGFQVEARGPRGGTVASVFGNVTAETVIGARFFRS